MSVSGPAEQVLLFSYPTVPSREQTAVDVGEGYPASAMLTRLPGGGAVAMRVAHATCPRSAALGECRTRSRP